MRYSTTTYTLCTILVLLSCGTAAAGSFFVPIDLSRVTDVRIHADTETVAIARLPILKVNGTEYFLLDDMLFEVRRALAEGKLVAKPWPEGIVHYRFGPRVLATDRQTWRNAAQQWTENTCITFNELPDDAEGEANLLTVTYTNSTTLDSVTTVGASPDAAMWLARWDERTIRHEIGHALGLDHEHVRFDRGCCIELFLANSNAPDLFEPHSQRTYPTPYDLGSVMHYSRTQTAKNFGDVIRPLEPYRQEWYDKMGTLPNVSELDRQAIVDAYCPAE